MRSILFTFDVSTFDKLTEVKEVQSQNKWFITVTWDKLKLEKSKEIKDLQPLNIPEILPLIEEESKWEKSIS